MEAIRLRAVDLDEQGWSRSDIAEVLDRSVRSVEKWLKVAREQGRDALKAKPHPGPPPKLTAAQRDDLRCRLVAGAEAAERDEAAIEHWVARDWPRIKKRPAASARRLPLSTKAACC